MAQYWPVSRTHRARRNRSVVNSCAKEIRDSLSLFSPHRVGDAHHESEIQRPQYASRGHFLKRFARPSPGAPASIKLSRPPSARWLLPEGEGLLPDSFTRSEILL